MVMFLRRTGCPFRCFLSVFLSLSAGCSLQEGPAGPHVMPANPLMSPVKKYMSRAEDVYPSHRERVAQGVFFLKLEQ